MAKILPRPEHSDDIRINVRAVVTHEDLDWRSPAPVDKLETSNNRVLRTKRAGYSASAVIG
jgi:hypothetical protein